MKHRYLFQTISRTLSRTCLSSKSTISRRSAKTNTLAEYEQALRILTNEATAKEVVTEPVQPDFRRRLVRYLAKISQPPPTFSNRTLEDESGTVVLCTLQVGWQTFLGKGITEQAAESTAAELALNSLRNTSATTRPPASQKESWFSVPNEMNVQYAVKEPWAAPIPQLAHGLSKILHVNNSVATPLKESVDRKSSYPYLRSIVQPQHINWDAIPPFTPASRDQTLHDLCLSHKAKYKGSTSSITGLLSHIYQVLSNFRPVETGCLSEAFKDQPRNFTVTQIKKPVVVHVRPRDGVWGIDAEQEKSSSNQILIDLGKTMERMLTMNSSEFRRLIVKSPGGESVEIPNELKLSSYNFSLIGDFMLRSQLDCIHRGGQIFDLKTRATHAIRNSVHLGDKAVPADQRYLNFLGYRLTKQHGLFNSFEREIYDMMRSCFLKYSYQLRIGRMHGAFVTYHNTREIFGFQYLGLPFIDERVFGSSHMANVYFDRTCKLLSHILDKVLENFNGRAVRLSLTPQKGRYLLVQAQPILSEVVVPPPKGMENQMDPVVNVKLGEMTTWNVWLTTALNGKELDQPWHFENNDTLQVACSIVKR